MFFHIFLPRIAQHTFTWCMLFLLFSYSLSGTQSVRTCAAKCCEATSVIKVSLKTQCSVDVHHFKTIKGFIPRNNEINLKKGAVYVDDSSLWRCRCIYIKTKTSEQNLLISSRYNLHDLLSAGFIPFTANRWSNQERADTIMEEIPRGFHPVYTSIEYKCASPLYSNTGSAWRTCLKTGRWSGRHVSCSPGDISSLLNEIWRINTNSIPCLFSSLYL